MNELQLGQIVRCTAGRDKGDWMIVTQIIDDDYIGISNGRNRKVSNPKKKKLKHVAKTNDIVESVQERLIEGVKVSNAEIRTILEPYILFGENPDIEGETNV